MNLSNLIQKAKQFPAVVTEEAKRSISKNPALKAKIDELPSVVISESVRSFNKRCKVGIANNVTDIPVLVGKAVGIELAYRYPNLNETEELVNVVASEITKKLPESKLTEKVVMDIAEAVGKALIFKMPNLQNVDKLPEQVGKEVKRVLVMKYPHLEDKEYSNQSLEFNPFDSIETVKESSENQ